MSNGCPVCGGIGRVLAFGMSTEPVVIACPECAGLAITPGSADEATGGALPAYSAAEITSFLLGTRPALPSGTAPQAATPQAGVGSRTAPGEPEGLQPEHLMPLETRSQASGDQP